MFLQPDQMFAFSRPSYWPIRPEIVGPQPVSLTLPCTAAPPNSVSTLYASALLFVPVQGGEVDLWASKRDGPVLLVLVFVKGNPEESGLLWVLKQKHQIKLEGVPKDPNVAMLRKDLTAYGTI
ncbi:hypothetical protein SAY86_006775 [Trapa natans]|uniref:Uncharacterized protein n=1 Tax=Trapa natans TaxID=22666 RepID=A0AAN7L451_TRANT|nr:hypothetical protein SAY86_006775 [Trapa natans]